MIEQHYISRAIEVISLWMGDDLPVVLRVEMEGGTVLPPYYGGKTMPHKVIDDRATREAMAVETIRIAKVLKQEAERE